MMENVKLFLGDCLELMKDIPDSSIDLILCDPPYGTTNIRGWDKIIDMRKMWEQYNRIIKPNGNIVLFGSQPFTSLMITSNLEMFRYEWIWDKTKGSNFLNANCQPLKSHENIMVFSKLPTSPNKKGTAVYNPQKTGSDEYISQRGTPSEIFNGGEVKSVATVLKGRHPKTIITFKKDGNLHPTQKPVALLKFIVKTYTNEGDTVLDNCMGSGSVGVACLETNRKFIGMEKEPPTFDIAKKRIYSFIEKMKVCDSV